jgi:diguanylate cyclase (GGDEF)-like protein/PAS domain S-box-containing protein
MVGNMNEFLRSDMVWRSFLANMVDHAIVILDEEGKVAVWSVGAQALQGYSAAEVIGTHFSRFYTDEARAVGHPERELAIAFSVGRYEEEGWRVRKDHTRFWAHVIMHPVYDAENQHCGFGKILRDVTERKQAAEQSANILKLLEYTARTDYLTGIDNRRAFDKAIAIAITTARQYDRPLSLAMIDLDRFKIHNDAFGHQAGDAYLRKASKIWRQTVRPEDCLARYGGEEFVVILPDTTLDIATICMERLRIATPVPVTCSIGLAQWDGVETPFGLINRADHALFHAKEHGRNQLSLAPMPDVITESTQGRLRIVTTE